MSTSGATRNLQNLLLPFSLCTLHLWFLWLRKLLRTLFIPSLPAILTLKYSWKNDECFSRSERCATMFRLPFWDIDLLAQRWCRWTPADIYECLFDWSTFVMFTCFAELRKNWLTVALWHFEWVERFGTVWSHPQVDWTELIIFIERNETQITAISWPDSFPTELETCTATTRTIAFHSFIQLFPIFTIRWSEL